MTGRSRRRAEALVRALLVLVVVLSVGGSLLAGYLRPASGRSGETTSERSDSGWSPGDLRDDGLRIAPSGRSDASTVLDPEQFTGRSRQAYWIAMQNPDVLNQLYCWCGCIDRGEHRSTLECFEDMMGVTCEVCQRTAEIAHDMVAKGVRDAGQIQARVDAELAPPADPGPEVTRDMRVIHGPLAGHEPAPLPAGYEPVRSPERSVAPTPALAGGAR